MARRNWMGFAAMLVAGLFLAGCGGDDNGLSSEDMARLSAAESAAMTAQAEAEAAQAEAEAAHEEAEAAEMAAAAAQAEAEQAKADAAAAQAEAEKEVVIPEPDTSAIDAALEALEATVAELAATPATPVEILGGAKGTGSAADLSVAATKIAGQLNATYDHDMPKGDKSLVNLPDISGTPADADDNNNYTRNIAHASGAGIMSADGTSKDKGFLRHSFAGGPSVDLTSPGDIATLKLGNLLKVNGVDLKSFSVRETDKMMTTGTGMFTALNATFAAGTAATDIHTVTTTLGVDGSSSVIVKDNTGDTVFRETIAYVGGSKVVEYNAALTAAIDATTSTTVAKVDGAQYSAAMVTRADGDTLRVDRGTTTAGAFTISTDGTGTAYGVGAAPYDPADPAWTNGTMLPAADQANAKARYVNARAPTYTIAQHNAKGYGAWLEDSFFVAYVISAEDDAIISDPDDMAMKIAWGGRAHDSDPAANLSGRGETAMWKGLMVGHDMKGSAMVKGNASVTARVSDAVLADRADGNLSADVVDVSLTNVITADGTAVARVADGIHWTNLNLSGGRFSKGDEIAGAFYDNGNEVVGEFEKEDILGVFGAMEYEMEEMMDMASQ